MLKHSIEVDSEVFAFLQGQATPLTDTANDVLRRLLLSPSRQARVQPAESQERKRKPGDLEDLLSHGLLKRGDRLVHRQPRKGGIFWATVTPDGYVRLESGEEFPAPSPALKAHVGYEVNGWENWIVERTNEPIGTLREQIHPRTTGSAHHSGKYRSLWAWLRNHDGDRLAIGFADIEAAIEMHLPVSCRTHAAHWSGYDGSAVARAIHDAGWRASKVDLHNERLVFVREQPDLAATETPHS